MKPNWIVFVTSLMMLLLAGSKRTSAQSSYEVGISEIRKANQTKAQLDFAQAQNKVLVFELRYTRDSLKVSQDSIIFWKGQANNWQAQASKFKRQRNRWRGAAILEAALIGLGLRQRI